MLNQKEKINLFFACDDNYVPFLAVTLNSIKKHISPQNNYNVVVLYADNINLDNQEKITLKYSSPNFEINFKNIRPQVDGFIEKFVTRDYYSDAIYYRLFIPQLYPELNKALYLDCDTLALDDVAKLYNTDLGNNFVGAIHDGAVESVPPFQEYVVNTIGCDTQENYFNSGVLLMNLQKLREIDFKNKFLNLLFKLQLDVAPDQDYLNIICKNKVAKIDFSWDVMPFENLKRDPKDIKLIHYNLSFKPWHKDGVLYEDIFWDYAHDCGYFEDIMDIKRNYPAELIAKADAETVNLIANAKSQADNAVRNAEIRRIIKEIMS